MKEIIKRILHKIADRLPLRNFILFESYPDLSDNTKYVFDEMCARRLNKKYKLIWMLDKYYADNFYPKIKNTVYIDRNSRKAKYYFYFARIMLCCNQFLDKKREDQFYIYLAHGCAFKNTVGKYGLPDSCRDCTVMTFSDFTGKYDALNLNCSEEQFETLGYPRTDEFFRSKIDLKKIFPDKVFDTVIYWLPTYRQHKTAGLVHSDISMPILYNEEIAQKINDCAKESGVLIAVKPHPAQDVSRLMRLDMSNIVFIDNDFLDKKGIQNYQLLAACDALVSDYSSVYYDYLLSDRPIGLCWDDFEEYKKREGFTVDPEYVMSGGEKIYNADDFCAFVSRVANGEDVLKKQREEIRDVVHKYRDGKATKRVVDFIENHL